MIIIFIRQHTLYSILKGIDEAGESTLSEIVSLYIVFSHLLIIFVLASDIIRGDRLIWAVPGDAPAAGERLLFHPRVSTLAEMSPRQICVDITRCGEPATRNEGASGKLSAVSEISDTVRHGPPYVLYGDDFEAAQNSGCRSRLSTESD